MPDLRYGYDLRWVDHQRRDSRDFPVRYVNKYLHDELKRSMLYRRYVSRVGQLQCLRVQSGILWVEPKYHSHMSRHHKRHAGDGANQWDCIWSNLGFWM